MQIILTIAGIIGFYYTANWFLKVYDDHRKYQSLMEKKKVIPFPQKKVTVDVKDSPAK